MKNIPIRAASVLMLALGLTACGGGDDTTTTTTTPTTTTSAAGSLTLSASAPASRDGTLDLSTATTSGNSARAGDTFSSQQPYCEIFWENVISSSGAKYAVQVYFRQSDQKVLHTSVMDSDFTALDLWSVFDSDGTAGISGVTVDVASKTLTYTSKVLTGDPTTETTTVNGAVTFPANATVPACGA